MPYYFMRDTPLQALEQLMMSQPGQKPRGGGIYHSPFHYTPKDVACEYCQNYVRKHPCRLCECTCLEERIEAGVLELNEFVRDCFAPSNYQRIVDTYGYGQQRLQETLGLDDEAICELDGYMDFEKYGTDCMENDSVIETEFGRLRRLEPPFPEQTQRQQMFQ